VLVGTGRDVVQAIRVRNIAGHPRRFELDPQGHFDARRDARSRGLSVIGFYHSHPDTEPEPSPTDRANAFFPDHLYVIARPLADGAQVRVFLYDGSDFVELSFTMAKD